VKMALRKRHRIYHCDLMVNGDRYRQTLEARYRRQAVQRECDLAARAKEGKLASGVTAEFCRLMFNHAVDRYLSEVAVRQPGSVRHAENPRQSWEGDLTNRLRDFFSAKRLNHAPVLLQRT
jgi:hypothetical protein